MVLNFFRFIYRNINFGLGAIGGVLMGSVAYYANWEHGFDQAIIPAGKQFMYTLIVGGSLVKVTERISVAYEKRALSIFLAILTPVVISAILLTTIHIIRGTPNIFQTILYTGLAIPPGFIVIAFYTRNKHDNAEDR